MLIMGYSFLWNISHIKIHQNGEVPFGALIYFRKNDFFMKNTSFANTSTRYQFKKSRVQKAEIRDWDLCKITGIRNLSGFFTFGISRRFFYQRNWDFSFLGWDIPTKIETYF